MTDQAPQTPVEKSEVVEHKVEVSPAELKRLDYWLWLAIILAIGGIIFAILI